MQEVTPDNVYTMDVVRTAVSDEVQLAGYRALLAMTLPGLVRGTTLEEMQLQGVKPLRVHVARAAIPNRAGWALGTRLPAPPHRVVRPPTTRSGARPRRAAQAQRPAVRAGRTRDGAVGRARLAAAAPARIGATPRPRCAHTSPELLTSGLSVAANADAMLRSPFSEVQALAEPRADTRPSAWTSRTRARSRSSPTTSSSSAPARSGRSRWDTCRVFPAPATRSTRSPTPRCPTRSTRGWSARRCRAAPTGSTRGTRRSPTQRLASLRAERPAGLQLGCWGLLVDVRPSTMETADVPAGWDPAVDDRRSGAAVSRGPLRQPRRQIGYQHAPSLTHARTAGVLRAGELAYEDGSTLASLDLTSRRARIARDILGAVANGQPLGAVLGYRLERSLGDAGLHDAVTTLRAAFPQRRSGADADAGAGAGVPASDHVVPPEVLDGLDVWRRARPRRRCARCRPIARRRSPLRSPISTPRPRRWPTRWSRRACITSRRAAPMPPVHCSRPPRPVVTSTATSTCCASHAPAPRSPTGSSSSSTRAAASTVGIARDRARSWRPRWSGGRRRSSARRPAGAPRFAAPRPGSASRISVGCARSTSWSSRRAPVPGAGRRSSNDSRPQRAWSRRTSRWSPTATVPRGRSSWHWRARCATCSRPRARSCPPTSTPARGRNDPTPGSCAARPAPRSPRSTRSRTASPTCSTRSPPAHARSRARRPRRRSRRCSSRSSRSASPGRSSPHPSSLDAYAAAAAATATVTDADRVIDGTVAGLVSTGAVDQPAGTRLAKLRRGLSRTARGRHPR